MVLHNILLHCISAVQLEVCKMHILGNFVAYIHLTFTLTSQKYMEYVSIRSSSGTENRVQSSFIGLHSLFTRNVHDNQIQISHFT